MKSFGEKGGGGWAALAVSDISWHAELPVTVRCRLEEQLPICLEDLEDTGDDPASLPSHGVASHAGVVLPGLFTKSNRVSAAKLL